MIKRTRTCLNGYVGEVGCIGETEQMEPCNEQVDLIYMSVKQDFYKNNFTAMLILEWLVRIFQLLC